MSLEFNLKKFSKEIISQRDFFDIGLRQAAKQIGTSAATLSRCENQRMPDVMTYVNICKWLNVPMETYIRRKRKTKDIGVGIDDTPDLTQG